jgi:hypothetical protein
MDDKRGIESWVGLNDAGDVTEIEIYFYNPIPIVDFGIEKILSGKCGGCNERNKKAG